MTIAGDLAKPVDPRALQPRPEQFRRRLGHRPALDGVRAIAIVGVMGVHAISAVFPGGFYGVDIFFVLSAFLITSLIYEELEDRHGRYSFVSFYCRRVLRLGPALVFWLVAIAAPTAIIVHQTASIPISTVASLFYFGDAAIATGMNIGDAYTHVWSLAVEEQFYVVWPAVFVFLIFPRRPALQFRILALLVAASVAVTIASEHEVPSTYFLPTGHLIPLAFGCLAALVFVGPVRSRLERLATPGLVGPICLAVLAAIFLAYRPLQTDLEVAVLIAVAVATTLLVLHVGLAPDSASARLLSIGAVVWLGRRSYGIYLFHRTFTLLIPALIPGITLRTAGPLVIAISLVVAEASFRLFERPMNQRGRAWLRKRQYPARAAEFSLPVIEPDELPSSGIPKTDREALALANLGHDPS